MATLRTQRGEPLLDAEGQELKEGSLVVDAMLAVRTQRVTRERRERRELCAAVGSKR